MARGRGPGAGAAFRTRLGKDEGSHSEQGQGCSQGGGPVRPVAMGLGVTQRHDWGWVRGGQAGIRERAFGSRGLRPRRSWTSRLRGWVALARHSAARKRGGRRGRGRARAPTARARPWWPTGFDVGNRDPSRALPGRLIRSQTPLSLRKCRRCPTWGLVAAGSAGSPMAPQQLSSQASTVVCCFLGSGAPQLPESVFSAPSAGRWLKRVVGKA